MKIPAERIVNKLNDLCEKSNKKYRFVAIDTFDCEWDAMEEMNDSWIVKVIE